MAAFQASKFADSLAQFEIENVKGSDAAFLKLKKDALEKNGSAPFVPKNLKRFLALRRLRNWWNVPEFGTNAESVPRETQLLLWERKDGKSCLLLPLVDGDIRATLQGASGGVKLAWEGQLPGDEPEEAALAIAATGDDPIELIAETMKIVQARLKTFRLRADKKVPAFVDYFGWCTWDAFYHAVDAEKVESGLASFKKKGFAPGFMMLDDGWQDVCRERMTLLSFKSDEKKFPGGLAPLIETAKSRYGVKVFGVWHAFEGYWNGVDPKGPLGYKYHIIENQKTDPPAPGESVGKTYYLKLLDPKHAANFYNDYHAELRKQGVDMVKVDNQSSLEDFTKGECGRVSSMRLYQEAFQGSSQNYFLGNSVHCMSNGSDVAFNLMSANVWRNSDDYYPKRGVDCQQTHVRNNALNAIWSSTFVLPDWDMFQTHGPCPEFHAAARALSGGPVYVCDSPNQQNFEIIDKLTIDGGSKALRFDNPALPVSSCVYVDSCKEPAALKIWNKRGAIGVLGVFNCQHSGEGLDCSFTASEIPGLEGKSFAIRELSSGRVCVAGANAEKKLSLPSCGWELATISPVDNGFAPFGLLDKFAGAAALKSWGWSDEGVFELSLLDGGRFGAWSKAEPKSVAADGRKLKFKRDAKSGLLTFDVPKGAERKIKIKFR